MSYVDFDFYKNEYKGKAITSEKDFDFYSEIGTEYVRNATLNKSDSAEDNISVKRCVCAISDVLHYNNVGSTEKDKSSESLGGYSVSYVVSSAENKDSQMYSQIYNLIVLYLANTGMLYRGV